MHRDVPDGFYRVSIKGLILDETGTKFLAILEKNGLWDLPGGGLEWGESFTACLMRELREEMGLVITNVEPFPSYSLVGEDMNGRRCVNLIFKTTVKDLHFIPSDECQEIRFVSVEDVQTINAFRTVTELAAQFDAKRHA